MSCRPRLVASRQLLLESARRLSEHVPPKRGQQFLAADTSRFFNQGAVFGRERSLQMNPVMNADGSDPKNSSERRLTAGYIACPG